MQSSVQLAIVLCLINWVVIFCFFFYIRGVVHALSLGNPYNLGTKDGIRRGQRSRSWPVTASSTRRSSQMLGEIFFVDFLLRHYIIYNKFILFFWEIKVGVGAWLLLFFIVKKENLKFYSFFILCMLARLLFLSSLTVFVATLKKKFVATWQVELLSKKRKEKKK